MSSASLRSMATKRELQAQLEIALLERDQLAQTREDELLERDTEIKELRVQLRELEKAVYPVRRMRHQPYQAGDPVKERTVFEVVLVDEDERYAPPEQEVMSLSMVEERVYLTIQQHKETSTEVTRVQVGNFCVHVDTLLAAVELLKRRAW